MYKVGIIGYGKMGILHGALVNGTSKAKIVAICDKSWVMRFGLKRVYKGVKAFDNVDEMLKKTSLDAVIISTPTFNHIESAMKCMQEGCHLFIEKPLASTYAQANMFYEEAAKKGISVQIGFCNRFAPSIALGKKMLDEGKIGKVLNANAYMYIADVFEEHSGWRYNKNASGGGVLMDFGIHMLDQICWYFGMVNSVKAESKKLYSKEVEDELTADINFVNGINVHFDTSWSKEAYRKSYAKLEIFGTNGKMVVTDQTLDIFDNDDESILNLTYPDLYGGAYMDVGGVLYSNQMQHFIDMLDKKSELKSNLFDAVYDQKIIEKIYESAERKEIVTIEER